MVKIIIGICTVTLFYAIAVTIIIIVFISIIPDTISIIIGPFNRIVGKLVRIETVGIIAESVSIGIAGFYEEPLIVAVSGLIVGLTGALNTVAGFYFFGRTQKKVNLGILKRIRSASESVPHVYERRVIGYMRKREISEETAKVIAEEAREKKMLTRIIAEEEYGIKEGALGDPVESAVYAGVFKVIGTVLPLIPFFMGMPVGTSIPISIAITLIILAVVGFLVAISAEIDVKDKIMELTVTGLVMSLLVFLIGKSTSQLMKMFIRCSLPQSDSKRTKSLARRKILAPAEASRFVFSSPSVEARKR